MREVLEPLALMSGVRLAAVITSDGVPVAILRGVRQRGEGGSTVADLDADRDLGGLAAQAASWVNDTARTVGQLSWSAPLRYSMRGTQGSLIVVRGPGSMLMLVLDSGIDPEGLRVPMDGAVARMQRLLRGIGERVDSAAAEGHPEPRGLHPKPTNTSPVIHHQGGTYGPPDTHPEQAGAN